MFHFLLLFVRVGCEHTSVGYIGQHWLVMHEQDERRRKHNESQERELIQTSITDNERDEEFKQ